MIACQVLISEISRVRNLRDAWPPDVVVVSEEELLMGLKSGLVAMAIFAVDSPMISAFCVVWCIDVLLMRDVIGYQLAAVQEAFESL